MRRRRWLRARRRIAQLERDLGLRVTEPELLESITAKEASERWSQAVAAHAKNYTTGATEWNAPR